MAREPQWKECLVPYQNKTHEFHVNNMTKIPFASKHKSKNIVIAASKENLAGKGYESKM